MTTNKQPTTPKQHDQEVLNEILGDIPGVFTDTLPLLIIDPNPPTWLTENIIDPKPVHASKEDDE